MVVGAELAIIKGWVYVRSGIRTHAHRCGLRPERSALDRSAILTTPSTAQTSYIHTSHRCHHRHTSHHTWWQVAPAKLYPPLSWVHPQCHCKDSLVTSLTRGDIKRQLPPERIELSTPGLLDQCSNH